MSATFKRSSLRGLAARILAAGCGALVFALTIFAVSPTAHGLLHDEGHEHAVSEDACAVVMFASGVSLPVAPIAVVPPTTVACAISPVTAADVFLVSPRYLRQPERGPPLSGVS